MTLHAADIAARLRRFLDRRQAPRRVEGKPQAEADEVAALVGVLERNAPRGADALAAWWPGFERELGESGTGLWPTEKDIREAAAKAAKAHPRQGPDVTFDRHDISAARMARGEAVGECYLYGREAVEMIRRRLVDEPTMKKYRSAAFFGRKDVQGEAAALRWEAEMTDKHRAAKDMLHDTERTQRDTSGVLRGATA